MKSGLQEANAFTCVGEVLWDAMPDGLHLGGAPLNVAINLHRLGAPVRLVSRVGDDDLGKRLLENLEAIGVMTKHVGKSDELPTGRVDVAGTDAAPEYLIRKPAAWDAIELDHSVIDELAGGVVVFGTLAQRDQRSRRAIQTLAAAAATAVLDVNLRAPFDSADIVQQSLTLVDVLKLNENELERVSKWLDLPSQPRHFCEELARRFNLNAICLTRGARGAAVWDGASWTEHRSGSVDVVDTVGSGDAFLAGFLFSAWCGESIERSLAFANGLGGFVATKRGATPTYSREDLTAAGLDVPSPG